MEKPTLLHSSQTWLHLRLSWIYDQIRFLDPYFTQAVWYDAHIPGPHDEWEGSLFLRKDTPFSTSIRMLNNVVSRKLLTVPSSLSCKKYDCLFSHFGHRAWYDLLYLDHNPAKKIVRFYGQDIGVTPKKKRWRQRYQQMFDVYDLLLCEGPFMAEQLRQLQAPPEKVRWIPLGIHPDLIMDTPPSLPHLLDPLTILIAAAFTEKKGIEFALRGILEFIRQEHYPVNVTLVGGANPDDAEHTATQQRLMPLLQELQHTPLCHLDRIGFLPLHDLHDLMRRHLIFLAPSVIARNGDIEGGFPVTLTHAAAKGMILVGSDHCDLPQIIHHRKNGILCRQKSTADIVDAFRDLISLSPQHLEQYRYYSIQLARETFDAARIASQLAKLIQGVT